MCTTPSVIHSSVDGHVGCFHVLTIVNSTAVSNEVHMYFSVIVSSGYMLSSRIAVSYGSFIPSFFFLFNLNTVFHSGYISLCFQQECKRIPLSS